MKKILVTGGTVFVSKNVAEYFAEKGYEVYILNRDNHDQPKNTIAAVTAGGKTTIVNEIKNIILSV